jgi:hypothetical protein
LLLSTFRAIAARAGGLLRAKRIGNHDIRFSPLRVRIALKIPAAASGLAELLCAKICDNDSSNCM